MQKQHQSSESPAELSLRIWGANIARQRHRHDRLSQSELGMMLEPPVHQTTVARWEKGSVEPSLEQKMQISHALGVPIHEIFPLPVVLGSAS